MATYDCLDFHIIGEIATKKNITTWDIAKDYSWDDLPMRFETPIQKRKFWNSKVVLIGARLKKMSGEGLVFISKNSKKNTYTLLKDNVRILDKHKFPDKYRKAVCIREKDGQWCIFSI